MFSACYIEGLASKMRGPEEGMGDLAGVQWIGTTIGGSALGKEHRIRAKEVEVVGIGVDKYCIVGCLGGE